MLSRPVIALMTTVALGHTCTATCFWHSGSKQAQVNYRSIIHKQIRTHTHTHIYIYIHI